MSGNKVCSSLVSSAQRLPNGNTLITEGVGGRVFEVTAKHEIVWEYVNPVFQPYGKSRVNLVYRAYRLPYEWAPQAKKPKHRAIHRPDNSRLRVSATVGLGAARAAAPQAGTGDGSQAQFCVLPTEQG